MNMAQIRMHDDLAHIESQIQSLVHSATKEQQITNTHLAPMLDAVVDQAIHSSAGGKRLRALLTVCTYDVFANTHSPLTRDAALDVACAIEVFQTAALIHDDIIDDSDMRRGQPSAHRALTQYAHNQSIGSGLALMLGDILATACLSITDTATSNAVNHHAIMSTMLAMQHEVEIGQVLDLAIEQMPLDNSQELAQASLDVFRWKTASYTTIAPLMVGMLAAGVTTEDASHWSTSIGEPLGIAFQLADDVLDVASSSHRTGKPIGGDIREGKRNVLLADALASATNADRDFLIHAFQQPSRSNEDVQKIIEIYTHTGAINQSRDRITALQDASNIAIDTVELDPTAAQQLREVCAKFIPSSLS